MFEAFFLLDKILVVCMELFFQAEDGIRDLTVTGVQTCALPIYDEQVVTEDLERVRAFYRKHGYQDIDVSHTVYRDPSGRGLYVHFTVAEGQQYRVGTLAVAGAVLFPEPQLRRLTTLKPGAVYNSESMQEDLRTIKQYYGDR